MDGWVDGIGSGGAGWDSVVGGAGGAASKIIDNIEDEEGDCLLCPGATGMPAGVKAVPVPLGRPCMWLEIG